MPLNIFITGGTSGIGLELAKLYVASGNRVGICGRDISKTPPELLEKYNHLLKAYECSVTDRKILMDAVADFSEGSLDVMIANAGISVGKKTKRPDFNVSRHIFETNALGVLHTFEAALSIMLAQGKGHLVGISSVAALVGLPGASAYSASKACVLRLCESYTLDLKDQGIAVSCICPGFIETPLTRKNDHSMPFLLSAEEGARRIKKAIDKQKVLYVFPWQMKIIMTLLEKMPRFLYRFLMRSPLLNYSKHGQGD